MSQPLSASVRVLPEPVSNRPVSRRLFGKFTEHLGRNVYGGAWAQILSNPDFAPAPMWPKRDELVRRLQRGGQELRLPALSGALAHDLPPYWVAQGSLATAFAERRGRPVLTLTAGSRPGRLVTPVYLPVQRTRRYVLELLARGAAEASVKLAAAPNAGDARRAAEAIASLTFTGDWTRHRLTLELQGDVAPGAPFHLALELPPQGAAELRQARLFPDDHLDGWDADVVRFMREAKLPLLRFPGGNFVSAYHWQDGVGPLEDRPVLPNPAWPEVEWNHVGTDEWLRLCELVGCEPLICINAGNGTPAEASAWVEYCNGSTATPFGALRARNGHPEPYAVKLWEVGNEIYGSWQAGHTDAAGYAQRYRTYAQAMRAADPAIELIANGDTEDWNRTVVFANLGDAAPWNAGSGDPASGQGASSDAPAVRSLSHHCLYSGYKEDADPERVYLEHMAFTGAYGELWRELVRPMIEAGIEPCLAITEQQVFTHRPHLPTNATHTEALWTASIINEAIRADGLIEMITHSALINHGGGLRKEREIVYAQPIWWTTHLYGSTGGELVRFPADVESPTFAVEGYVLRTQAQAAYLDAVALGSRDRRRLILYLINRHPQAPLDLKLTLPQAYGEAALTTLAADSYLAVNAWDHPDRVKPVAERRSGIGAATTLQLPPLALVRLELSATGGGTRPARTPVRESPLDQPATVSTRF